MTTLEKLDTDTLEEEMQFISIVSNRLRKKVAWRSHEETWE